MSDYRTTLIEKYQNELQSKQASLADITALLPDFDNLLNSSQYALKEKKRLMDRKAKLEVDVAQLNTLLQDMQNEVDDSTPIS
ncbi:hypothetical protein FUAX_41920 (plasmid) [Fulvitalea axinellae]|uniref:Uncharacterized protein n=1 Tax=Fulvitalea axinellae TaxID=1182444 RepID=A0AAU9DGS3_9BACT|nr:hypothetical protein FUAX_41920 [Fulvitalea axinellae]